MTDMRQLPWKKGYYSRLLGGWAGRAVWGSTWVSQETKGPKGSLGPGLYDSFLREEDRWGRVGMLSKLRFGAFAHFLRLWPFGVVPRCQVPSLGWFGLGEYWFHMWEFDERRWLGVYGFCMCWFAYQRCAQSQIFAVSRNDLILRRPISP